MMPSKMFRSMELPLFRIFLTLKGFRLFINFTFVGFGLSFWWTVPPVLKFLYYQIKTNLSTRKMKKIKKLLNCLKLTNKKKN